MCFIVCCLCAVNNANSMHNFNVKFFNDKSLFPPSDSKYFKITLVSQVDLYLGKDGFLLKMPVINLVTKGWSPTFMLSIIIKLDKALLAVPMVL